MHIIYFIHPSMHNKHTKTENKRKEKRKEINLGCLDPRTDLSLTKSAYVPCNEIHGSKST